MVTFANTETVTILRPAAEDDFGDPTGDPADVAVDGCVVWPNDANGTAGNERNFQEDTVFVGYSVLMPPGTDVRPSDQVNLRGTVYEVAGEPGRFTDPFASPLDPGVLVTLHKAT